MAVLKQMAFFSAHFDADKFQNFNLRFCYGSCETNDLVSHFDADKFQNFDLRFCSKCFRELNPNMGLS